MMIHKPQQRIISITKAWLPLVSQKKVELAHMGSWHYQGKEKKAEEEEEETVVEVPCYSP